MSNPTIDVQFEEIRKFVAWALGCPMVYGRSKQAAEPKPTDVVWGELVVMRAAEPDITDSDLMQVDLETDDEYSRQEVLVSQVPVRMQATLRSRSQIPSRSAWFSAASGQRRLESQWARTKWLSPANVALVEVTAVNDGPKSFDNRIEDMAIFELLFYIVLVDADEACRGTWIEHVEISSDELSPMADSLQLDEEIL
jgi:hypothetical protein